MTAWTPDYAQEVRSAFYDFLDETWVKSKEKGWIVLGDNLYGAQTTVVDAIFEGLGRDIHDFKVLKSRQLGVSTIIRALMAFWTGMFDVTASLMFDTAAHLQEARLELVDMMQRFPTGFRFPKLIGNNRSFLVLENKSRINLIAAGVKETKSSQTLGTGSAITVSHRSELCNYGNIVGMETFRHSLARTNPNRLFVDESTAKGFNIWKEIWDEAGNDHHCMRIFCGWWSHPDQKIDKDDPDFEKYGIQPLSKEEQTKIRQVYAQYGHEITAEQLAWIRRDANPGASEAGDADPDFSAAGNQLEQQPWTEEDAFQMTGSVFFDPNTLTEQARHNVSRKYRTYHYNAGIEFSDIRVFPAPNAKSVQLKVWEEPIEQSVYIVAADVAYGRSEFNDSSAIQVMRAFADGLDQVAEYRWPLINSKQLAWVIASLEAWYAGDTSEIYRIVDVNGPGEATWRELMDLKMQIRHGYFGDQLAERGLQAIGRNVRNYIYTRSDSMSRGHAWQFKANTNLKVAIMERLRDFVGNGMVRIRSAEALEEMRSITREGDAIEAQGSKKDDRVYALAMGVRHWEETGGPRKQMIMSKRTRAFEEAARRLTIKDQVTLYNQNQFDTFMAGRGIMRRQAAAAARRASWRSG